MKLLRHILFLVVLLAGNTPAYTNSIFVGVSRSAPPFSAVDGSNHYFGFCIDLMNEICKRLNTTCEYKPVTMLNQMDELNSGNIDLTFPPGPIPAAASESYIYSLPYMTSDGQFLVNSSNIKTIAELKNKRIGVLKASHLEDTLLPYTSKDNISEYPKISLMIMALLNNDVDAIVMNINMVKYLTINKVMSFQTVGQPITLGNGYGIVALAKNADLVNRINKILLQIENDGTYATIYNKYFGS
ncbi:transporter substrate-binding domain-containing protein [Legionella parisiensis]|uniref:Putative ABC transporter arginine-binding protein 2 n=1 Tax=Legionella parisiensis TaxID=45071 RepID=A0A1E5JQ94_9GAMM|nr:transporter substrate-binding domain-containing protein [Legionella parisiensis]KTD42901.1 arginine-binding periplasmic protein [Legionella parisiensis]OEH46620.1 putative ABC transporter arginine-binding protein 2 [Legionella parisiensis]STX78025.1 arginine-binding periplasmic protein [Legionella parisiensis]